MKDTLRAEWSKIWSDGSTRWLLTGLIIATVAVGIPTALATKCPSTGCVQDPAKLSLNGIFLGQIIAAVAGVLAIGNEYGTGMIGVSLTATPRRLRLLTAKALALAGPMLAASALAVVASMLGGWLILPGHGFTAFDPGNAADWRASFGAAVYLTLIALLALGVTTVVRESAVAIGVVLGLLFLFPILITGVSNQTLIRHLEQISPLLAGQDILATTGLTGQPLSPWPALGVVALWAAGALLLAGLVFRRRDA